MMAEGRKWTGKFPTESAGSCHLARLLPAAVDQTKTFSTSHANVRS
jgi:hypothetical protein